MILLRNNLHHFNVGIKFIQNHPTPWDKPPGHNLKGAKTLLSGQNRESKVPPLGHKVKKFTDVSTNSDTI